MIDCIFFIILYNFELWNVICQEILKIVMNKEKNIKKIPKLNIDEFSKYEIRIGTIIKVSLNKKAIKSSYIIEIDFGKYGLKKSCSQITKNYRIRDLLKKQIIAVINLPPKKIAGIDSEVLILGVYSKSLGVILIGTNCTLENGSLVG